jgi:hypothetical protein
MKTQEERIRSQIQDLSAELIDQIKLIRDYATTPGNSWLAKNELTRLQSHMTDLEELINQIKDKERD